MFLFLSKLKALVSKGMKEPGRILPFLISWPRYKYLRYKYRNRPYMEFYKEVMKIRTSEDPFEAVGGRWDEMGKLQFEYLVDQGLRAEHKVLDFGCGCLRAGLHLIQYLDRGNYWGMDISPEILQAANKLVSEWDLRQKDAKLILNKGLDFAEVHGTAFDFIIAQSVLTHMPLEDVKELFSNAHRIMKTESVFFATFHDGKNKYYTPDYQNFFYPFPLLRSIGAENGLDIIVMGDYDHPRDHRMLKITTIMDNSKV